MAADETALRGSLKRFNPTKVQVQQNIAVVQTSDRKIGLDQFAEMVIAGCRVLVRSSISELQVVNFSGRYGFAFERPGSNCKRVLEVDATKVKVVVAGHTHSLP
jgi:hypothetical protein